MKQMEWIFGNYLTTVDSPKFHKFSLFQTSSLFYTSTVRIIKVHFNHVQLFQFVNQIEEWKCKITIFIIIFEGDEGITSSFIIKHINIWKIDHKLYSISISLAKSIFSKAYCVYTLSEKLKIQKHFSNANNGAGSIPYIASQSIRLECWWKF